MTDPAIVHVADDGLCFGTLRSVVALSTLRVQISALHREISRNLRTLDQRSLAIYVHVLSTEDVIVQVLLRDKPPVMLSQVPLHAGQAWQSDYAAVRRYAAATHRATATFLTTCQRQSGAHRPIEHALEHFLIPALARAAADMHSSRGR